MAEHGWLNLLKGEIIATSNGDLAIAGITLSLVLAALWRFNKEFLLVSFDRELAVTLQRNVVAWDLGLFLLIGFTVAVAVLSVGPLIAFGFLVIPPLIARQLAGNMRQLALASSLIGGVSALIGFWLAYRYDLPVGPTNVAVLALIYLLTTALRALHSAWKSLLVFPESFGYFSPRI